MHRKFHEKKSPQQRREGILAVFLAHKLQQFCGNVKWSLHTFTYIYKAHSQETIDKNDVL